MPAASPTLYLTAIALLCQGTLATVAVDPVSFTLVH